MALFKVLFLFVFQEFQHRFSSSRLHFHFSLSLLNPIFRLMYIHGHTKNKTSFYVLATKINENSSMKSNESSYSVVVYYQRALS